MKKGRDGSKVVVLITLRVAVGNKKTKKVKQVLLRGAQNFKLYVT